MKSSVFSRCLNVLRVAADVTEPGRLFHTVTGIRVSQNFHKQNLNNLKTTATSTISNIKGIGNYRTFNFQSVIQCLVTITALGPLKNRGP